MLYDFVVIGGGMMGAPCARYLSCAGHRVALIAPPEPTAGSEGPWASHYDAARITRQVASTPDWARLSQAAIARYRDIETESGETLFAEVGGVMAGLSTGPLADFTEGFCTIAHTVEGAEITTDPTATGWHLPSGSVATWEHAHAGWIDPRAMTRAQITLARTAGADVFQQPATTRLGTDVTLADGTILSAGHVVVATGPHAGSDGLLPARPDITVWARTIAFIELTDQEAARLAHLPTLIWVPGENWDYDLYALPPVRYPDGKFYLKIGGQKDGPKINSNAEMADWFSGQGDADVATQLLNELRRTLPGLHEAGTHAAPCAVTWTKTGMPYIDHAGPNVTALIGGNGSSAKCGDEIGRLGALFAQEATAPFAGYQGDFKAAWL